MASTEYYTIQNNHGVKYGPMTFAQLEEMARHGRVKPMTMVLVTGVGRWQAASTIPEIREVLRKLHPSQVTVWESKKTGLVARLRKKAARFAGLKAAPKDSPKKSRSLPPAVPEILASQKELYTIRAGDGVEYGPTDYEEVKHLVKLERIKATTMIYSNRSKRWHLAASIPEIRALVRKYMPSQEATLDRLRAFESSSRDPRKSTTVRLKVRQPFWKKFFSS